MPHALGGKTFLCNIGVKLHVICHQFLSYQKKLLLEWDMLFLGCFAMPNISKTKIRCQIATENIPVSTDRSTDHILLYLGVVLYSNFECILIPYWDKPRQASLHPLTLQFPWNRKQKVHLKGVTACYKYLNGYWVRWQDRMCTSKGKIQANGLWKEYLWPFTFIPF